MDNTHLSPDLPEGWTDMLSHLTGNGAGSTAQFDAAITPREAFESSDSFTTPLGQSIDQFPYQTAMSQLNGIDPMIGLQPVCAITGTPGPSTVLPDPQDLFSLPPHPTSSTINHQQSDTPAQLISTEAHSQSGEPQVTFEKSAGVKQLRQKYHEKYKERNRLAAGKSRQKQVDLIALLEAERRDEERRRRVLEDEIQQIQRELYEIKQELHHHILVSNCVNMVSQGAGFQNLGPLPQGNLR